MCPQLPELGNPEKGVKNSTKISHVGDRNSDTHTIICYFPGSALAGDLES